ncbi:MAG: SagB/ThcOx family dehydrogenase [Planctomycetota bacterium]
MESMEQYRQFLKTNNWRRLQGIQTDQNRGIAAPAVQKPYAEDAELFDLVGPGDMTVGRKPLFEVINQRRSRRNFTGDSLTLEELSFLLWVTQGIQKVSGDETSVLRTVPSGGARHSFETYLLINRVEGLKPGLYRYLSMDHKLCFLRAGKNMAEQISGACCGQKFVGSGAAVFIWTAIPYRMEWRYSIVSHKVIAIDAGHMCQNLYLAAESIGAGTCAIGAYFQDQADEFLGVDGREEFVIYIAPVGKIVL